MRITRWPIPLIVALTIIAASVVVVIYVNHIYTAQPYTDSALTNYGTFMLCGGPLIS
jgi:hypothetical protein